MVLDYSKFNNIVDSDDEEEEQQRREQEERRAAAEAARKKQQQASKSNQPSSTQPKVEVSKPQEAKGSAWNMNSWHYEEQNLSKWGKQRLQSLLKHHHECFLEHEGLELEFNFDLSQRKVEGDCWTHIRKGKKVDGKNYDNLSYTFSLASSLLTTTRYSGGAPSASFPHVFE